MSDETNPETEPAAVFEEERRWRALEERARRLSRSIGEVFPTGVGPDDVVSSGSAKGEPRRAGAGRRRVAKLRRAMAVGELDWSPFFLEGPAGFREALPVLLAASLDEFPSREDLMVGATLLLRPSCDHVARKTDDSAFRQRLEVLTEGERASVAEYLALLVDLRIGVSFLASKSLRWGGWAQYSREANEALEQFLETIHRAPPAKTSDSAAARAVDAVREGFDRTPAPPADALCDEVIEHGRDLGVEIALEFAGLDWRGLSAEFLHYHAHALALFTPEGFRYFLPAFLIADLTVPAGKYDPLGALAEREEGCAECFEARERRAIAAYLRYKARDEEQRVRATALLRRFAVEE